MDFVFLHELRYSDSRKCRICIFYVYTIAVYMEIYQTAATSIALKFSDNSIAVNPPKKIGKASLSTVILRTYPVSLDGWESIEAGEEQQMFYGPGEYEKNKVHIRGVGTETVLWEKKMQTTSWCVDAEGIRVLVMGDVHDQKDILRAISDLGDIDVLIPFCMKTKDKRLDAVAIAGVAATTQAQRIIPIGDDDTLKNKIGKELGDDTEDSVGKYVLKKKDLLEGRAKVVLFT